MIVVKIKSGLGNQMFQYAFGRALSLSRGEELSLDISYYDEQNSRDAKREFLLSNYLIAGNILSAKESLRYSNPLYSFLRKVSTKIRGKTHDAYAFNAKAFSSKRPYYEGYWINEKYFEKYSDQIKKDFSLKNGFSPQAQEVANKITSSLEAGDVTISLHVRRGDFVSNPNSAFNGVLGVPYYEKALGTIKELLPAKNFRLFVFSDDHTWTKANLQHLGNVNFVDGEGVKDYEELILMSLCSHNIIANSTFSWWGAWLNKNKEKIVVAPYQWLKERNVKELELLLTGWIPI